jgi:hypothetical protein
LLTVTNTHRPEEAQVKALIEAQLFREIQRDRERAARRRFNQRQAADGLVIRNASDADNGHLERLALLDSAPVPAGPVLVAEQDGMLVAAVPLHGGRSIADPFVPSADIVSLLELRRTQLRAAG